VITVVSNKGGVGKTTVATNLAITLRALHENLPIWLVTLDDQSVVERMFRIGDRGQSVRTLRDAFVQRSFDGCAELGEFGVHFVPAASDLEALTRAALAACDLAILPVADRASLEEAQRAFELLAHHGGRSDRGRVLFTLVDRRTKLDAEGRDLYERLSEEVETRGWLRFAAFLSRSPRVEALNSGKRRPRSLLHEAKGTLVQKQLRELAEEVGKLLGIGEAEALPREVRVPRAPEASRESSRRSAAQPARDVATNLRDALFRGLRGR